MQISSVSAGMSSGKTAPAQNNGSEYDAQIQALQKESMDITKKITDESQSSDDSKTKREKMQEYQAQQQEIQEEIKMLMQKKTEEAAKAAVAKHGASSQQGDTQQDEMTLAVSSKVLDSHV